MDKAEEGNWHSENAWLLRYPANHSVNNNGKTIMINVIAAATARNMGYTAKDIAFNCIIEKVLDDQDSASVLMLLKTIRKEVPRLPRQRRHPATTADISTGNVRDLNAHASNNVPIALKSVSSPSAAAAPRRNALLTKHLRGDLPTVQATAMNATPGANTAQEVFTSRINGIIARAADKTDPRRQAAAENELLSVFASPKTSWTEQDQISRQVSVHYQSDTHSGLGVRTLHLAAQHGYTMSPGTNAAPKDAEPPYKKIAKDLAKKIPFGETADAIACPDRFQDAMELQAGFEQGKYGYPHVISLNLPDAKEHLQRLTTQAAQYGIAMAPILRKDHFMLLIAQSKTDGSGIRMTVVSSRNGYDTALTDLMACGAPTDIDMISGNHQNSVPNSCGALVADLFSHIADVHYINPENTKERVYDYWTSWQERTERQQKSFVAAKRAAMMGDAVDFYEKRFGPHSG